MKVDFNSLNNINNFNTFNTLGTNNENSKSFGKMLMNSLKKVNELQLESEKLNNKLVTGEIENVHQVVIATQKAEIALQFTMQIRNKIIDAYNEIMRMSI